MSKTVLRDLCTCLKGVSDVILYVSAMAGYQLCDRIVAFVQR